ncbi:G2/M phase-specific E3 ubiquitin-protein ligase [Gadus chalcogrammus]|uniref:G2/M phase-specific E3 ubiquitin-protein ligase n=1 Tax=Gadus chalcogrammus TaxID=1042646 RepID=UPI0024C40F9D|nr:G2/M phase-specific E3 ubiquitin-protein ligase [Gadus chalcogrammus]
MKTIRCRNTIIPEDCCVLCRQRDDTPDKFGERVYLEKEKLTIHYLCLLTASGVYQRGEEDDGVFGFLVDDIIKETRRCSRLTCGVCKRKGAAVGCCVGSCKKKVHFPCGPNQFIFQFSGEFMSYCVEHGPKQSLGPGALEVSLPQACSVCLDPLPPLLGYSVLKCPSCHTSWFHRACIQRQAISAGLHFFRCTLCNNKERFQEEMLTMGIYIPERDASWELESNAFEELLQVYENCDAPDCCCRQGRSHSAKTGWFEIVRCKLCGSRGTHRRCSGLDLDSSWACLDCTQPEELRAPRSVASVQDGTPRRSRLSKRFASPITSSPISCKRGSSSTQILQALAQQLLPAPRPSLLPLSSGSPRGSLQSTPGPDSSSAAPPAGVSLVEVQEEGEVLGVALALVRRPDFDPRRRLFVRFKDGRETPFPSCPGGSEAATQWFLKQLVQQIQSCEVFEGPDGHKNLALDAEALRGGLYLAVGRLLSVCLVHGAPPLLFLGPALFQGLFGPPGDEPLGLHHMTPDTHFTRTLSTMATAQSLEDLKGVMAGSWEYLELAGCNRPISSLDERDTLVEDLVSFTLVTRLELPLQRLREGLKTLGVFEQVQLNPAVFFRTFCGPEEVLDAHTLSHLLTPKQKGEEPAVLSYWRTFLQDCEEGRSSVSLQDVLRFTTGVEVVPAAGLLPSPSLSLGEEALFPRSDPSANLLLLPSTSSCYQAFKSSLEQAVSHHTHLLHT